MNLEKEQISILLVDDNQVDIDLTLLAFARIKFSGPVQIARDGAETLEIVDQWIAGAPLPRLILLDIKLPKVSGLDVLKVVKKTKRTKNIPVVMLTSSANDVDIRTAYEYGANSYVIKPVDFDQFIILVTVMCDYWIKMNVKPEDLL
jgi:CheY-like chemotaxis protein